MKISILVWDLSSHSIVRTYPIAKVLERHYQVEVLGPIFGSGIYEPYKDEFVYKYVKPPKVWLPVMIPSISRLIKKIEGDVIYAFKPMPTSYGLGLLAKLFKKLPLVLDIEDWDACFFEQMSLKRKIYHTMRTAYSVNSGIYKGLMEHLTGLADQITVVSNFLQKRSGGTKLPHGADCSVFNPKYFRKEELKEKWNVHNKKNILFSGTALPHKGLEELIRALEILNHNNIQLLIVGKRTEYLEWLIKNRGSYIKYMGLLPHLRMPECLSLSDLVVLPQRNEAFAQAQVPGKIFEAMAMAKPIVATNVSDLPEILDGCGWIVEPENPEKLAEAIKHVLDNPEEAEKIGQKAQQKCIEKYSWDAMEKILLKIFKKYE
jgi:glycosyltransferase involved in cell wall biosynthesis